MTLIAVLVIANGGALAVNAPSAVESRGAEPQEDLFATRPAAATPAPNPVTTMPPPAAATAPADPQPTGNPLWGKPLNRLTATRERPLFAPTRRPPAVALAPQPVAAPLPPPKPVEPEKPQLSLLGTVAGSREKMGLFLDSATKSVVRLKAGENHKGWVLRDVNPREVELARGLDTAVLSMPSPDMKAGGAPPLAMPAAATMPAASGNPPPLQTSLTGQAPPIAAPMGPPPSGATIVVRPPSFQQQPAAGNPFQQAGPFPTRMQ
ncbi:hypothetical protein [Bradyrhizobium sp. USDA 377]